MLIWVAAAKRDLEGSHFGSLINNIHVVVQWHMLASLSRGFVAESTSLIAPVCY
jgi:hypothetical protein